MLFQSTHPVRGATYLLAEHDAVMCISIHAPREGCDRIPDRLIHTDAISIHAPREGCDAQTVEIVADSLISIHAPREGCDPCSGMGMLTLLLFQSTHPVRGATTFNIEAWQEQRISIHAPREGCDGTCEM